MTIDARRPRRPNPGWTDDEIRVLLCALAGYLTRKTEPPPQPTPPPEEPLG
jgi:hypothetical protein